MKIRILKFCAVILTLSVLGCESNNMKVVGNTDSHGVFNFEHEGHMYLIVNGTGIIHSESCSCKVK